jgi:hypothetical protein
VSEEMSVRSNLEALGSGRPETVRCQRVKQSLLKEVRGLMCSPSVMARSASVCC